MNDINAVISSDWFLLSWQKWALIASSPRQSQDTASVPKTVNLSWVLSDGCLAEVLMRSHFVLGVARESEKEGCHGCYCASWRSGSSTEFKRSFSYTHSSTSLAEPVLCKCFHNSMCLCGSLVLHYYPVQALRRDETLRFCILPESSAGSSNNEEPIEMSLFSLSVLKAPFRQTAENYIGEQVIFMKPGWWGRRSTLPFSLGQG